MLYNNLITSTFIKKKFIFTDVPFLQTQRLIKATKSSMLFVSTSDKLLW